MGAGARNAATGARVGEGLNMATVAQLKKALEQFPDDAEVVCYGSDDAGDGVDIGGIVEHPEGAVWLCGDAPYWAVFPRDVGIEPPTSAHAFEDPKWLSPDNWEPIKKAN